MGKVYKQYDKAKQAVKPLIPRRVFTSLVNSFHWLETFIASVINGFPARSMKFVGITGTNGKTTTAILTTEILREAGYTVGLNSTALLGVGDEQWDNDFALTTANPFQMQKLFRRMKKAGCDWVVMEVASHALVQHRTWGIRFETVVFTNLTRDHLDYHHTMEEYARAKGKLFSKFPRVSVLNKDSDWCDFFAQYPAEQQINYGTSEEAECRILKAKLSMTGIKLKLKLDEYSLDLKLNLPGKFNAYNALAAATTAYAMNISLDHIKHGLEHVKNVPGRMQIIDEGQDFVAIIDHAHTPDALENILKTIRTTLKGRLITLIGADGDRDPGKREPLGKLAAAHSEVVIVTDQEPYTEDPEKVRAAVLKGAKSKKFGVVVKDIADRREAIKQAFKYAKSGDVVLIPGLGNQLTRGVADGKMAWDEREVARELLHELLEEKTKK